MKRFWLILLSLGLIVAFSTSAMAVDVKFSGEFYAAGLYLDKTNFVKTNYTIPGKPIYQVLGRETVVPAIDVNANNSTAFYFQRLRLNTNFIVSPGLSLTTRADIMERAWGATRSVANTTKPIYDTVALDSLSAGTRAENENIAFDLAYVTYVSPIGMFIVGYQIDGAWGTVFGDNSMPTPRITYGIQYGGITAAVMVGKGVDGERSRTAINNSDAVLGAFASDRDQSFYTAFVKYNWKGGEAAILGKYIREAGNRNLAADLAVPAPLGPIDLGFKVDNIAILPYVKAQLGPVALQAEFNYLRGWLKYEGTTDPADVGPALGLPGENARIEQMAGWIDATADFGMFYGGGSLAYVSGNDPATTAVEGYHPMLTGLTGGIDWNPCLIMFNNDLSYWAGGQYGYDSSANAGAMKNAYFAQLRGGFRPIDKVDIMLSGAWAHAVKTPTVAWENRTYGYEVDLTATYKITNNLSYMLGAGYLFTGNYFKGEPNTPLAENEINNDFLVINKLTLTF